MLQEHESRAGWDAFVSYASADRAFAEAIAARLETCGLRVWLDVARLRPGCDWHAEIEAGCEASRVVVPILTPRWRRSEWTRFETYGASVVVPWWVEGTWDDVVTPPLQRFQSTAVAGDPDASARAIADAVRRELAGPPPQRGERLYAVRHLPNPWFGGRDHELLDLHEALFVTPTTALSPASVRVLHGLGGVGKTTLARHYVEKFWRCYRQIRWVSCRQGVVSELAGIHDAMFSDGSGLEPVDKATRVRAELSKRDAAEVRLVVFDDAPDEASVADWIPASGTCHVVVTSRYATWSAGISHQLVGVLAAVASARFLFRRAGLADNPPDQERAAAAEVAVELGHLPLALEQAAAYVGSSAGGGSYVTYRRLLGSSRERLLRKRVRGSTAYPDSVWSTWSVTSEQLGPGAKALLRAWGWLSSAPVPTRLWVNAAGVLEAALLGEHAATVGAVDEVTLRDWLGELAAYSMVRVEADDACSVHALVRAVQRDVPDPGVWGDIARGALAASDPGPGDDKHHWPTWQWLAAHALAALPVGESAAWTGDARLRRLARHLSMTAAARPWVSLAAAHELLDAVEGVASQGLLADREETIRIRAVRATLLRCGGQWRDASVLLEALLADQERVLGSMSGETAKTRQEFGIALMQLGRFEEAEVQLRDALRVALATYGADHHDVLVTRYCLAHVWMERGDRPKALAALGAVLVDLVRTLGSDDPDSLQARHGLAQCLMNMGRMQEAEVQFREVHEAQCRVLGAEAGDTLLNRHNVALLAAHLGRFQRSEEELRATLEVQLRTRPDHPWALVTRHSIAQVLGMAGKLDAAVDEFRAVYDLQCRAQGVDHPLTLMTAHNVGGAYHNLGLLDEAERWLVQAVDRRSRTLGPEHPSTLISRLTLARVTLARSLDDESMGELRNVLADMERVLGHEHRQNLAGRHHLATALASIGRLAESLREHEAVAAARKATLGRAHPDTLISRHALALTLERIGRAEEARSMLRAVLLDRVAVLGDDHPDTLATRAALL